MEFQVKVEHVKHKWITFVVSIRLVSAAEYRFKDLVRDITSRCTTLNETTIRLRYLDDTIGNVRVLTSKLCVETCVVSLILIYRRSPLRYSPFIKSQSIKSSTEIPMNGPHF